MEKQFADAPKQDALAGKQSPQRKQASLSWRAIFPILYWIGFFIVLAGLILRFWMDSLVVGLSLGILGVGLLLAARIASAVGRRRNL